MTRLKHAGGLLLVLIAAAVITSAAALPQQAVAADGSAATASVDEQITRLVIETERGPAAFQVELAVTPREVVQGLQHRRTLAADAGMLFDFGAERIVTMWMKNTYIPLDMLFIDARGVVADIAEHTEPLSLATIASRVPVRAVLEVNSGTAARLAIRPGDRIDHPIFAAR